MRTVERLKSTSLNEFVSKVLDRLGFELGGEHETASQELESDEKLPRRDRWLLPLIVLSVLTALLGISELTSSLLFAERGQFSCEVTDASGRQRQKPNCVCRYKNPEGPDVEYRFNECGYRSIKSCGAKPPGTLRVVFMGTSVTMGLYVPSEETFAARTEKALNQTCRRPVEVQNLGGITSMSSQPDLVEEALKLSPDVVVLTVVPFDIEESPRDGKHAGGGSQSVAARIESDWYKLELKVRNSHFALAIVHFVLQNEQMLYQVFLRSGASRAVLSVPPSPAGERMYGGFATTLSQMTGRFNDAGVPLVVLAVPNRVAAAMLSNHSSLEGVDPWRFGHRISEITEQLGAVPVDVTPGFAATAHAEQLFYPMDNHPTGKAHAIIAQALVERLTDGSIPQLAGCRTPGP